MSLFGNYRHTLIVVSSLIIAFTSMAPGQTRSSTSNVERDIKVFLVRWNDAIAASDATTVRSSYVSDDRFNWFEDGKLTYSVRDQIIAKLGSFPKGTKVKTRLSDVRVSPVTDKLALSSASFETRIQMPTGTFSFGGVFTAILENDGIQWRFLSGHTSTLPPDRRDRVEER